MHRRQYPPNKKGLRTDSRNPLLKKRKTRVKCHTIIHQEAVLSRPREPASVPSFEFYRFRFHFEAVDCINFSPGESGNRIRGTFGRLMRNVAVSSSPGGGEDRRLGIGGVAETLRLPRGDLRVLQAI